MTKVQLEFALTKPLDEKLLDQISRIHGVYGMSHVQVLPSLDRLLVEYDATRLNPREVEAVLASAGLPIAPPTA